MGFSLQCCLLGTAGTSKAALLKNRQSRQAYSYVNMVGLVSGFSFICVISR
jgi:hypothetical protein